MVQRNSSFPEGIRFQDHKVSLRISLGVSHELWGNYWMDSGELNIQRAEFADSSSEVMEKSIWNFK